MALAVMKEEEQLVIDVAGVSDVRALHRLLSSSFGFPDYYGENWDAFDECIRDVQVPPTISVVGIDALARRLPREAELLVRCLSDFAAECSEVQVHFS
jgi:RNAse (barnase) inhibitor barstar